MGLQIHQEKIDAQAAAQLAALCPFGAITADGDKISIGAGCRLCKMCVRQGPAGAITFEADPVKTVDKDAYKGIAVFGEHNRGQLHNVTLELLGKAAQLAQVTHQPIYAVLIGYHVQPLADEILRYGADKVYVYDDPALDDFRMDVYANAFSDFITKVKPSSILVGATNIGRSLAPRVAARFHTGLTADCTKLEMKPNTDLVQIRPAFGGNIMAQIVTTNTRPQFCTVRYKTFDAPQPSAPHGQAVAMTLAPDQLRSTTAILDIKEKAKIIDISEAKVIVAVGRGLKSRDDIALAQRLADLLGAQLACTRPLVEAGWFDAKRQIGLSGRTVHAKLIITLGVSGSVQFAAGMRGSEMIVAINSDPHAGIFDIAHYGLVGDLYEIVPQLIAKIEGGSHVQ